jgi:Ca2+-binding EF-hand superfamily protein
MKTKTLIVVVTALGIAGVTYAQEPSRDRKNRVDRPIPPEVLEKFDTNKDGKLDETERQAMRESYRNREGGMDKRMLERFDKDGDGKLSGEEKEAMKAERKAKQEAFEKEMIQKFDKDGDGKLSEEERAEAKKAMRGEYEKRGKGKDGEKRKEKRDGGGNEAPGVLGQ